MDKNTLISSFGKWVAPINFSHFEKQVAATNQDKYTKKLTTKAYLMLFLYAHLQEEESLRAISDAVLDEDLGQALGLDGISASQLSRKNREVDPSLMANVFLHLVQQIHRHKQGKKRVDLPVKIIDSSTIPLSLSRYKWATFRKTKAGVKLHLPLVLRDKGTVYPEKAIVTPANIHDRTQLEVLIDEKEAMYVFDRGYVDYERFDRYCDKGIFFASRLKKNAVIRTLETFSVAEESPIMSDSMVVIGTPQKRTENVFRLIETVDSKGNVIRLVTNRFDLSAEEIGDIYRSRWAIELFFKWLKQHVRIKTFFGTSEEAIQNQIFMALIAYCLLVLVQMETKAKQSILQLKRWLKSFLWKSYEKWFHRIQFRSMRRKRKLST
jgi:IS4 transposase